MRGLGPPGELREFAKYRGPRPARAGWGSKTRKCQKTQNFAWEMVLDHFLGHVGSAQILTPMGGRHRGEAARGNFEDVFRGRLRAVPRAARGPESEY